MQIDKSEVQKYWQQASERGCPWASGESGERIPLKIFGDDCVYDERQNKAYAVVLSLPLWRPKSARNSRFLIWAQKSSQFVGFETLQPLLARMVWSLNMLYDQPLEKSGYTFAVCEIGGDWAWNRFFWQLDRHWNSHIPCPFCNVQKTGPQGYSMLNEIQWLSTNDFIQMVGSGGSKLVNPFILLRNFHMSLVAPCQLHNLNLGLLWTSNGAAVATFAELGYFGDPTLSLAILMETAWDDFLQYKKQERRPCSQNKFTIKMIFKKAHGAYFSAKGYNSRVLADWLADCAERAWGGNLGGNRIFGSWLQGHPQMLQLANGNEQLAPLCLALLLGFLKINFPQGWIFGWVWVCRSHVGGTLLLPSSWNVLGLSGFPSPDLWLWGTAIHVSCDLAFALSKGNPVSRVFLEEMKIWRGLEGEQYFHEHVFISSWVFVFCSHDYLTTINLILLMPSESLRANPKCIISRRFDGDSYAYTCVSKLCKIFEPRSPMQATDLYDAGREFLQCHRRLTSISMRRKSKTQKTLSLNPWRPYSIMLAIPIQNHSKFLYKLATWQDSKKEVATEAKISCASSSWLKQINATAVSLYIATISL